MLRFLNPNDGFGLLEVVVVEVVVVVVVGSSSAMVEEWSDLIGRRSGSGGPTNR